MISTDPLFYGVAILAVLVTGISKSGLGGVALLAVPLLSLVISPLEAAAITLPLLLMMDFMGVFAWRGKADWSHLKVVLPGSLIGVVIGTATAQWVDGDDVKLVVGLISVLFCLYQWFGPWFNKSTQKPSDTKPRWFTGSLAGMGAGYTSYIAHAGSVPYHIYIIPKGLDKAVFAATGTWFFTLVNMMKMPAYYVAGMMDWAVILQALVLAPFVPIGVYAGLWLNKRINPDLFYKVIYGTVFIIGLKLIWDSF